MNADEVEALRAEVDALVGALEAERFRHVAGLEPAPDLERIFDAHGRAAHRKTADALAAAGEGELSRRVAALRAERVAAPDEEAWRAAESTSTAPGPGGLATLEEAQLAIVHERNRERRLAFGRAAAECSAQPAREAAVEKRARAAAEVGLLQDWERVVSADGLLATTDEAYRDVLLWLARREAQLAPTPTGDLTRADLLFVLALHGWDGLFPRGGLAHLFERTLRELRLPAESVRVDEGTRPAQWPGAHAVGARVSFRRQGGVADHAGLLDAAGQALQRAAVPAHRRDDAAVASMGALLRRLLLDRGWLAARLEVEKKHAGDLVRALALRELFALRAHAAALRVATEVERGLSGHAWHEAHREALSLAALATWPPGLAARDADGAAHAAALAGAARAEVLLRSLVERFDEDWWRNPRASEGLAEILAGGSWIGEEPGLAEGAKGLVRRMQ